MLYSDFLAELDSFGGFDLQSVLCDFERGLHNAISSVWPSATIGGCYFHFKQALWRKLQAFDLVPEYKVLSSPVRKWFKTIGALPFMEPGSVVDVWTNDIVGNLPQEMNEFASYFERTWIGTPTAEPIFDKYLWNMYDTVLARLPRFNNIVLI